MHIGGHDNAVFDLDAAYLKRRKKLVLHEISFKFFDYFRIFV